MAWTESGLFYASLRDALKTSGTIVTGWDATTSKISLSSSADTPSFQADPATWSSTNEITGGANWPTGGVAVSAAAGGATLAPAFSIVGTAPTTTLKFTYGSNLSVASTTTTGSGARGGYLYRDALSPKQLIVAIWFGGSDYATVSGTFAITWNASGVITVTLAA